MIESLTYGFTTRTDTCVSSNSPFHDPTLPVIPFDPEEAERLLDEAGYTRGSDGTRFSFQMPLYDSYVYVGEVLREYWKDIGVDCELMSVESTTFFARFENSATGLEDFAAGVHHMGCDSPEDQQLYSTWPIGNQNMGFYSNAEVDELLDELRVMVDPYSKEAEDLCDEIQRTVYDDYGFIFLWNTFSVSAYDSEFHDIQAATSSYDNFLNEVWWEGGQTYEEFFGTTESPPITDDVTEAVIADLTEDISKLLSDVSSLKKDTADLEASVGTLQLVAYASIIISIVAIALPIVRKN